MENAKENAKAAGDRVKTILMDRKGIALRFVFTLFFFIILELLKTVQVVLTCVQYLVLFVTTRPLEPIRMWQDRLAVATYRVMRYLSLNENAKPFPFTQLPEPMEPAEAPVFEK